jgi:hypothetical protein
MWFFRKKPEAQVEDWRDGEEACFAPPGPPPPPNPRDPSLVSLAITMIKRGHKVPDVLKLIPAKLTQIEVDEALAVSARRQNEETSAASSSTAPRSDNASAVREVSSSASAETANGPNNARTIELQVSMPPVVECTVAIEECSASRIQLRMSFQSPVK